MHITSNYCRNDCRAGQTAHVIFDGHDSEYATMRCAFRRKIIENRKPQILLVLCMLNIYKLASFISIQQLHSIFFVLL